MKFLFFLFFIALFGQTLLAQTEDKTRHTNSFLATQLKQTRVKVAKQEADSTARLLFAKQNLSFPPKKVFIRVFKADSQLELWAENPQTKLFVLLKTYPICYMSGILGGKNAEGDMQVPEGFYYIDAYNPNSNYYLSVKINYPNSYDRYWKKTGGAICIHGSCVSIGCISIEDAPIKELYWILIQARNAGQTIPVHIFPKPLHNENLATLKQAFADEPQKIAFWENIKTGYNYFEQHHKVPTFRIKKGLYVCNE
jgi:murein L,D-transpeptidase YafK